jgi:hypothetical protein
MEVEVLDIEPHEPLSPPKRNKTRGLALAGVGLLIVVGLQLIPDPPTIETTAVPDPVSVDTAIEVEIIAPFHWVEVKGLDRFESVTMPVTTDSGYMAVGKPPGISGAASVVVSNDGNQWNRWGTIHGVGGEVEISELERSSDEYRAFGTYTEIMPKTEYAIHDRIPAVWTSDDAISWEMQALLPGYLNSLRAAPVVDLPSLRLEGSVDYLGQAGDAVAVLLTATTSTVSVREPGMRGDPFATRMNETTQSLLISRDQIQWASEVVPFDRIAFVGDLDGKFLLRAWSDAESAESSFWLVTP